MIRIFLLALLVLSTAYGAPKYLECVYKLSDGRSVVSQVKIDEEANIVNLTMSGKTQNMIAFFSPTVISGKHIGYGGSEESIQIDRSTLDYVFALQLILDNRPFGEPSVMKGSCKVLNLKNQI